LSSFHTIEDYQIEHVCQWLLLVLRQHNCDLKDIQRIIRIFYFNNVNGILLLQLDEAYLNQMNIFEIKYHSMILANISQLKISLNTNTVTH